MSGMSRWQRGSGAPQFISNCGAYYLGMDKKHTTDGCLCLLCKCFQPGGKFLKSAPFVSVLCPGTAFMCWALTSTISNRPSIRLKIGFQYTPPPICKIGGGPVKRGCRRVWTDAEDHADLLLIDLHPFDQSAFYQRMCQESLLHRAAQANFLNGRPK